MNVCFLCSGFFTNGGIGRVISIIANNLAKNENINVFLLSFSHNMDSPSYSVSNSCHHEYIFETRTNMRRAMIQEHAVLRLTSYLKENKIDVIVAGGVLFYPLTVIAAKKAGIKSICWEHTDPNNKRDFKFQDVGRKFGAKRADCNVLLTKSAQAVYNQRFSNKRNVQIYNPVDARLFDLDAPYAADSKKIVSVGRLRAQKNFGRLLYIAAEIMPKHKDWTWDIYGDGELRQELEEKIQKYHLERRVFLKGQVTDMYERYSFYAFMVMTSDYEGFPMTLLEGASQKLPLVAFDVPTGPNEIIVNGQNGFLCPAESDELMKQSITTLMDDCDMRTRMSFASRKTADLFNIDEITAQWVDLLNSVSVE